MKYFLPAMGWLLGVSLFSFLLDIYNKFTSNNGYSKVSEYIKAGDSMQLSLDSLYGSEFGWVEGNMDRSGGGSFPISKTLFYDSAYKKYFMIAFCDAKLAKSSNFDYTEDFNIFMGEVQQGEKITALVNKIEIADNNYGTKQNPIPVFWFKRDAKVSHKTFESVFYLSEDTASVEKIKCLYPVTVGIYLSHMKSKADFEKMFEK